MPTTHTQRANSTAILPLSESDNDTDLGASDNSLNATQPTPTDTHGKDERDSDTRGTHSRGAQS
ncbi:hypothetical protein J1614_009659 [Plenodomus biglobosus]|nr:hypothetical protein J1614_009659 [Plenodomus biglobosus]